MRAKLFGVAVSRRLAVHEGGRKNPQTTFPTPPLFFLKYLKQILCMEESQMTKLIIQMTVVIIVEQRYLFYFNAAVKH